MAAIAFLLELYFAAMLGVSGLAKIEHPEQFANTLRRHDILPKWSIAGVSRAFPCLEVGIALLLIAGQARLLTAALVIILFASFAGTEIILVVTKRATECGCYGVAYPQKVDGASVFVFSLLIIAAAAHLGLVTIIPSVRWEWRLGGILLFGAYAVWLGWHLIARHREWSRAIDRALTRAYQRG